MKNIDVIEPFQATITDTGFGPLTTLVAEACVSAKESICSDGYGYRLFAQSSTRNSTCPLFEATLREYLQLGFWTAEFSQQRTFWPMINLANDQSGNMRTKKNPIEVGFFIFRG